MFDPTSAVLRRIMKHQNTTEQRLKSYMGVSGRFSAIDFIQQQNRLMNPPFPAMLAGVQQAAFQSPFASMVARYSALTNLGGYVSQASKLGQPASVLGYQKMLAKTIGASLATPAYWGALKDSSALRGVMQAEHFFTGRMSWLTDFTPNALDIIGGLQKQWEVLRERDRQVDLDMNEVVGLFQKDGWYVLPVLYYSDFLLPVTLLEAAKRDLTEARGLLIDAMKQCRSELLGFIGEKITTLGIAEDRAQARWTSIERQFNLAIEGENIDGVASFMVSEAEGLFNDVTQRLGLQQGCFYTQDKEKIKHRKQVLDTWHSQIKDSNELFDEDFSRRHLKMFTGTRARAIPKRDAMQHGELGHRSQESALWATSFLMLTLEYLSALNRIVSEWHPEPFFV